MDSIQVCNRALAFLGQPRITAFFDETVESRLCGELYDTTRQALLRSYPWNCATKVDTLAKLPEVPNKETGHSFYYQVPVDELRIIRVVKLTEGSGGFYYSFLYPTDDSHWERHGDKIATSVDPCPVEYIRDIESHEMDLHLQDALAYQMAADLAYALTGSSKMMESRTELALVKLQEARTTDSLESGTKKITKYHLSAVRV